MKINTRHHRILAYTLAIAALFVCGRLSVFYQISAQVTDIQQVPELSKVLPVIHITDIKDAQVIGTANTSQLRILSQDEVVVPDEQGDFILDITHLGFIGAKKPVIKHTVPEWAQYVASKNGKYYYSLDEKQAKRLSVPNRMYFRTEEEAGEEGYLSR